MTLKRQATILGGLPVFVEITSGKDADTPNGPGEHWSEVCNIWWLKHDGTPGKLISQKVYDRAEKYDPHFCNLIENCFESEMAEQEHRSDPETLYVEFR